MKKAIFLDRDGVLSKTLLINGKSFAPRNLKDFKLFFDAAESTKKLKSAGFMIFVVTNQPDVGRKLISKSVLEKMHNKLKKKAYIDEIYVCTHSKDKNCFCRKPNPGMIFNAAKKHQIDLKKSFLIGDRASDIEAGQKANCRTIFLDKKYREKIPTKQEATFSNLKEATDYILKQERLKNA